MSSSNMNPTAVFWMFISVLFLESFTTAERVRRGEVLTLNISETAPGGTLVVNKTQGSCNVTSTKPNGAKEYFSTDEHGSLVLSKPLDLEVIYPNYKTSNISVDFSCGGIAQHIFINITPENEFKPVFFGGPYEVEIKETTNKGSVVFSLNGKANDLDVVKYERIVSYNIHPYLIGELDGIRNFAVDSKTGNISTTTEFDYESMSLKYLILNVTVTDDGGRVSDPANIKCIITDQDDMPPEFAAVRYHSNIDVNFQGELDHVVPGPIYAEDGDKGINASVTYGLVDDTSDEMLSNIRIDNATGQLYILEPFVNVTNNADLDPNTVVMTIVATEETANRYAANVTMELFVYKQLPTPPTPQTTQTSTLSGFQNATHVTDRAGDEDPSILLIKILVPSGACVVIILVVVVVLVLRKQRQTTEKKKYDVRNSAREIVTLGGKNQVIDTLSSTTINPYELIGAYAHIDLGARDAEGSESNRDTSGCSGESAHDLNVNEDDTGNAEEIDVSNFEETEAAYVHGDGLYAKVEIRKPRKKKNTAGELSNDDVEVNEKNVDEGDEAVEMNNVID